MQFPHFNRRLHLYLAMALLPWVMMYALSSALVSHAPLVNRLLNDGLPMMKTRFERSYDLAVPPDAPLKTIGAQIMRDSGSSGAFHARREKEHIIVERQSFLGAGRLTYSPESKRLLAEDRRFRWDRFINSLHFRGGFAQDSMLNDAWGVVVDIVCVGFLVWAASGIYMWWRLRASRWWGLAALAGGFASFVLFVVVL